MRCTRSLLRISSGRRCKLGADKAQFLLLLAAFDLYRVVEFACHCFHIFISLATTRRGFDSNKQRNVLFARRSFENCVECRGVSQSVDKALFQKTAALILHAVVSKDGCSFAQ